ncbi:MAG TPA: VWA domain-containing protein [Pirellulaceae bacterium]|nr:VWA domain-containing protein [Pirellulaceae bacterium]
MDVSSPADAPLAPRRAIPAWLLSLACHLAAVVLGCLLIRGAPPPKGIAEADRPAGIVLVQRAANQAQYFSDDDRHEALKPAAATAAANPGGSTTAKLLPASEPPLIAGIDLPSLPGAVVGGEGLVTRVTPGTGRGKPLVLPGLDDAAILAEDAAIPREAQATGPTAQLSLFGSAAAEGRSFVFVIDRSQSMGANGLGVLGAAAEELTAQLGRLTSQQTFEVVAYNQSIATFAGRELVAADDKNKDRLVRFVANMAAYGQTEHLRGLVAALKLKPEVIFLLTDGGDPVLDNVQLRTIRDLAAGRTSIHTLHFGRGAAPEGENFLQRLAAENRGSYVYIDMNRR